MLRICSIYFIKVLHITNSSTSLMDFGMCALNGILFKFILPLDLTHLCFLVQVRFRCS